MGQANFDLEVNNPSDEDVHVVIRLNGREQLDEDVPAGKKVTWRSTLTSNGGCMLPILLVLLVPLAIVAVLR